MRFYDRQFVTREHTHKNILTGFESLLNDYLNSDKTQTLGLPSVNYCAGELNLSAKYFGDLIKKETGKSVQEFIQLKLIDIAKEKNFDTSKSVSEIAMSLGLNILHTLPGCLSNMLVIHQMNTGCLINPL